MNAKESGAAAVKPRLRFDKGVVQLTDRLRAALDTAVPEGRTIVVTCTAPIRLTVKTAEAIAERVRKALANGVSKDIAATINDNGVRVRFVDGRVKGSPGVLVFVHNPGPGVAETVLGNAEAAVSTGKH